MRLLDTKNWREPLRNAVVNADQPRGSEDIRASDVRPRETKYWNHRLGSVQKRTNFSPPLRASKRRKCGPANYDGFETPVPFLEPRLNPGGHGGPKYAQTTLGGLMDGKAGKNWSRRSKAFQYLQRTGGGLQVRFNQVFVQSAQPRSFGDVMGRIRALYVREWEVTGPAVPSTGAARKVIHSNWRAITVGEFGIPVLTAVPAPKFKNGWWNLPDFV